MDPTAAAAAALAATVEQRLTQLNNTEQLDVDRSMRSTGSHLINSNSMGKFPGEEELMNNSPVHEGRRERAMKGIMQIINTSTNLFRGRHR